MMETQRRFVEIDPDDQSLRVGRDRIPAPGADEILIEVSAAGINRADVLQRRGKYPPPPDASPIMGLEVAGTVKACGEAVQGWQIGDPVCALTHGGGYASHAVAPVAQSLPVPSGFSDSEAAALPEALLTVWHNIVQRCQLRRGENILIHGGASGVGTLAVGICHHLGATVYSTAGSAEKCRLVEELGAAHAFNYREQDFVEELQRLGLRDDINVILDMVGGDYVQKNFAVAAPEARIVYIAFQRGFSATVNFLPMLTKRLTLTGSTLRAQSAAQKAQMVREIREELFPALERGEIRPVIDSEYPLDEVELAHARMESGEHSGKIILRP